MNHNVYEVQNREFKNNVKKVETKLNTLKKLQLDNRESEQILREIQGVMSENEKVYKQMELMVLQASPKSKYNYQQYNRELKQEHTNLGMVISAFEEHYFQIQEKKQVKKGDYVLFQDDIYQQNMDRIQDIKKDGYEAEQQAIEAKKQLYDNRNKLEAALRKNKQIASEIQFGDNLIQTLNQRRVTDKIILLAVVALMVGGLILVLLINLT